MKRLAWILCSTFAIAATITTAFAGTAKIGPVALAVLYRVPDAFAFFAVGLGLLVVARRRDRAPQ